MANKIRLAGTTANSFQIGLQGITLDSSNAASPYTLVLPSTDGNANQILSTDGSGNLNWVNNTGGTPTAIVNGTSNVTVDLDSNVRVSVAGTSNSAVFTSTGVVLGAGASGNISGANIVSANLYKLNLSAAQTANAGEMTWNASDGTMDLGMLNGVTQQVGQETYFYVKANAAITNGRVVMFDGVVGGTIKAKHANTASAGFKPSYVMGVATQDIALNDDGYITAFGKVNDIDTSAYPAGSLLWLNPNSDGNFTVTEPAAPGPKILVAASLSQSTPPATNGRIFVRPDFGLFMNDLHNVTANNAVTGDVLVYNSSNIWATSNTVPSANTAVTVTANAQPNITSLGTLANLTVNGTANIGNIANVKISGGSNGQFIQTDGSGNLTFASSTGSKEYLCASATDIGTSLSVNTKIVFDTLHSNNGVTYNTTTGNITLNANKTYRLTATSLLYSTTGNGGDDNGFGRFVYSANNTPLVDGAGRSYIRWYSAVTRPSGSPAELIFTPSSISNVSFVYGNVGVNGTVVLDYATLLVQEI